MQNRRFIATVAASATMGLVVGAGAITLIGPAGAAYGTGSVKYTVALNGANEAPAQGDPNGSGTAKVNVKTKYFQVCVNLKKIANLALPATAAHIHQGAQGVAGPIRVNLAPPTAKKPGKAGKSKACATISATIQNGLVNNPSGWYVNVHTTEYPGGAIRGQLAPVYP